jgi:virginiamycin B lyase
MSTAWQLTQFALPQGVSGAGQITSGPDGALWFTEICVGLPGEHTGIGRVTTGGAFQEFAGAAIGCPNDIMTGKDGALWFVNDHVGRLTTDGDVWSIPLPFAWYGANKAILQSPDGSIWIANQSGLGRLVVTPVA